MRIEDGQCNVLRIELHILPLTEFFYNRVSSKFVFCVICRLSTPHTYSIPHTGYSNLQEGYPNILYV
jgi:hypothetical protein